MLVTGMINNKGNVVKNQYIIEIRNEKEYLIFFQSYESIVCKIDFKRRIVSFGKNYDYSVTTRKYLLKFLQDSGFDVDSIHKINDSILIGKIKTCGIAQKEYKCLYEENLNF